jgi:hypothetical protein
MKKLSRKMAFWLWVAALIITILAAAYQKRTGPTHPLRGHVQVGSNRVSYKLLRSADDDGDGILEFKNAAPDMHGSIRYMRYKSTDDWTETRMQRENGNLTAHIPRQPAAGKVMYQIALWSSDGKRVELTPDPVVIRFKGHVPLFILIPHIALMFSAMLFSTRSGLEALTKGDRAKKLAIWTALMLVGGGIILGPIVQKYAFGAFWTGWPLGHDLTDNKTAFALLFWVIALWRSRKKPDARVWYVLAAVMLMAVYMIPHSVLGSEIDYTKNGAVRTGQ